MLRIADNRDPHSWACEFRRRRVQFFSDLLRIDETTRFLDVGGTAEFWENAGVRGDITILNLSPASGAPPEGLHYVMVDARDLSRYHDAEFDVVFSNSVIEHVGTREDQRAMAREVRRVGRAYFVQTPNRNFPIEPHFIFPPFQFLPTLPRRSIAKYWQYGWYEAGSPRALNEAEDTQLITCSELSELFPDAFILGESFLCFNKSLIATRPPGAIKAYPDFRILWQLRLAASRVLS